MTDCWFGTASGAMLSGALGDALGAASEAPPGTGSTRGPDGGGCELAGSEGSTAGGADFSSGGGAVAVPGSWNMCKATCTKPNSTSMAPPATKSLRRRRDDFSAGRPSISARC